MTQTRGERNRNPGNIRTGSSWQGLSAEHTDPDFCVFVDVKFGIRALAKVLLLYQQKGFDTVRKIVQRWAPSNENNTAAYVSAVAGNMRVDPDMHLDVTDYTQMYPLVDAIIRHENGSNIYTRPVMDAALALAGVRP